MKKTTENSTTRKMIGMSRAFVESPPGDCRTPAMTMKQPTSTIQTRNVLIRFDMVDLRPRR